MAAFVAEVGPCTLVRRRHCGGTFAALARTILFQQLATGAATAIHGRFVALYDGRPTPEAVAATDDSELRAIGLSTAKLASVKDLATRLLDRSLRLTGIARLSDEDIAGQLCQVRGIGPWTVEMFLMFQLNRPDVWPVGDLGVRHGYARIHHLPAVPTARDLVTMADRYRPWRTVVAWYCWRAMDSRISPPAEGW